MPPRGHEGERVAAAPMPPRERRPVRVAAVVLAAGAGRRFGAVKQLAPLAGRPLLEHPLRAAAEAPGVEQVVVVLGAHADEILAAVDLHGARSVVAGEWEEGVAASLRAGVEALAPEIDAALVLLGDQPHIGAPEIERVIAAAARLDPAIAPATRLDPATAPAAPLDPATAPAAPPRAVAVRAVHGGRRGHPVLLPRALFPELRRLRGDRGASALLTAHPVIEVECGEGAIFDVDHPADIRLSDATAQRNGSEHCETSPQG